MRAGLFSPLDGHNWNNRGGEREKKKVLETIKARSDPIQQIHHQTTLLAPPPVTPKLHHLTQKGPTGCPGPATYCFPPRRSAHFNTLIRCDKFNELVCEEEKAGQVMISESGSQGNLWTADSCQPHSSSSSQLNMGANKALAAGRTH